MDRCFDPDAFIRRIGERLVEKFKDAKAGTTPATVGSAAEQPVRDQTVFDVGFRDRRSRPEVGIPSVNTVMTEAYYWLVGRHIPNSNRRGRSYGIKWRALGVTATGSTVALFFPKALFPPRGRDS